MRATRDVHRCLERVRVRDHRSQDRFWEHATIALAALALVACSEPVAMRPAGVGASGSAAPPMPNAGTNSVSSPIAGVGSTDSPTMLVPIMNGAANAGTGAAGGAGTAGDAAGAGTAGQCTSMFCANTQPDAIDCGTATLTTNLKVVERPGNVMVIFDRSSSMEEDWNGSPRFQAVGDAFLGAIGPIQDRLTIGAVFFPSPETGTNPDCPMGCNVADPVHWIPGPGACCLGTFMACAVNTIDKPDQIAFAPATSFVTEAPMKWRLSTLAMGVAISGGTPLGGGVDRAAEAIAATTFTDPLAVVILTDGEPNCDTDPQRVLDTVRGWQMKGIATHVIGIPGAQGAADVLNALAMAGGTNNYIDPASPMELEMRLRAILQSTVRAGIDSCEIKLEQATAVPADLALIATVSGMDSGIARDLSAMQGWQPGDGWNVNAAGDTVNLTGRLCELAKEGTYEKLRFVYGCPKPPPPPPPPPPPRID